jgi:hypothetical protein
VRAGQAELEKSAWRLLTQGTAGFVGEARKRLGILGVLVEQRGRLAWGGADCGSIACPSLIQEATQPQEDYQQEVTDGEIVYHNVSLLLGEIDDRLHGSQAGDLSARWRYTTLCRAAFPSFISCIDPPLRSGLTHTVPHLLPNCHGR